MLKKSIVWFCLTVSMVIFISNVSFAQWEERQNALPPPPVQQQYGTVPPVAVPGQPQVVPQPNVPPQGYPQQVVPQPNIPPQGYPQQVVPQPNVPPQGYPQQGAPQPPVQPNTNVPMPKNNNGLVQYQLPQNAFAEYAPQRGTAMALGQVLPGFGGSITFSINYQPTQEQPFWKLAVQTHPNGPLSEAYLYDTLLDRFSSITNEKTILIRPKRQIQKIVNVEEDNDIILGKNKVIKVSEIKSKKEEPKVRERRIGIKEPVLSLTQMIVWIGSIGQLPQDGIYVRWVVDSEPLPVIVKMQQENGFLVYTAYAAPNREIRQENGEYLVKFVYPLQRINLQEFMFPQSVWINLSGKALVLERVR